MTAAPENKNSILHYCPFIDACKTKDQTTTEIRNFLTCVMISYDCDVDYSDYSLIVGDSHKTS
jgi:hypothetical protein